MQKEYITIPLDEVYSQKSIPGGLDVKPVLLSEGNQMHSVRHSLYHVYASSLRTKRKEITRLLCPQCNQQMNERSDNLLGINFDGSYYIKRAITIHLCNQCNYLQR